MLSEDEINRIIQGSLDGKIGPTGMKIDRKKMEALMAKGQKQPVPPKVPPAE